MKGNSETFDVQSRDLNDVAAQSAPGDSDEGPVGVNAYSLLIVEVDVFMPGCPPSPDTIHFALSELIAGRRPDFGARVHFG